MSQNNIRVILPQREEVSVDVGDDHVMLTQVSHDGQQHAHIVIPRSDLVALGEALFTIAAEKD